LHAIHEAWDRIAEILLEITPAILEACQKDESVSDCGCFSINRMGWALRISTIYTQPQEFDDLPSLANRYSSHGAVWHDMAVPERKLNQPGGLL